MTSRILVEWHNPEKTILRQTAPIGWTMHDYWESIAVAHALLDSVPHRVYLLTLVEEPLTIPVGFLGALYGASQRVRPNEGLHVVVCRQMMAKMLFRIATVRVPHEKQRIILVDTLAQAEDLIAEQMQRDQHAIP